LHKEQVTKKKCTPTSAFILCYSAWRAAIETRPDKPHRTWLVAELGQPMAENSRQPCVARRGRWGPRTPREGNHSWWLSAKL